MVQKYIASLFNQRASTNTIFHPLTREYQDAQDKKCLLEINLDVTFLQKQTMKTRKTFFQDIW